MSNKVLGSLRSIPANAENTRTIPFILSTYEKDRHGTVLNQDNWLLDNYRKNPVVSYQHVAGGGSNPFTDPNPDFVIGKAVRVAMEGYGKDKKLVADLQFEPADLNPLAEKIFRKVLFGSLSSASVGFLEVGTSRYGTGDEARSQANETIYLEGQELLEWSVVNIPSNPGCNKRSFQSLGQTSLIYACNKLSDTFRPSVIESLTVDAAELLIDLKEAGVNMEIISSFLANPKRSRDQGERIRELVTSRLGGISTEKDIAIYRLLHNIHQK